MHILPYNPGHNCISVGKHMSQRCFQNHMKQIEGTHCMAQWEKEDKFGVPHFGLLEIISILKQKVNLSPKCVCCILGDQKCCHLGCVQCDHDSEAQAVCSCSTGAGISHKWSNPFQELTVNHVLWIYLGRVHCWFIYLFIWLAA